MGPDGQLQSLGLQRSFAHQRQWHNRPHGGPQRHAYVPDESLATLKHLYHAYGKDLWGPFGFTDAFNLSEKWLAPGYVAIDQGPIVVMIENYRTQLCWNLFMSNPEIQPMLKAIGWTRP
jgi:hypothetical protein